MTTGVKLLLGANVAFPALGVVTGDETIGDAAIDSGVGIGGLLAGAHFWKAHPFWGALIGAVAARGALYLVRGAM